jgi:hypothetical protein
MIGSPTPVPRARRCGPRIEGRGFMDGPYATVRVGENVFLPGRPAWGPPFERGQPLFDLRAARLGGRSPEYLNNLGYHFLLRGDRKRARALFNEALALDPNNAVLQGNPKPVNQWKSSEPL